MRPADKTPLPPSDEQIMQSNQEAIDNARKAREKSRTQTATTFEAFEQSVYKDPGGKYIVNGDTPILNRKQLKEFYDRNVATEPKPKDPTNPIELAVNTDGGLDTVWNGTAKKQITYCVSSSFGSSRHQQVVNNMAAAAGAWEQCSDVKYTHVPGEDGRCNASNTNVVFDVRPVDVGGEYLARAFFPNEPRSARNVLIDETAFDFDPAETLQLVGILRHELGHTLGMRHEHTRPEAGTCFEDPNWRPLTRYDAFSVMHYPQCNGGGDWSLALTPADQSGIACLYGPAAGFTIDPGLVDTTKCLRPVSTPSGGQPTIRNHPDQRVARGQEKDYPVVRVRAGTQLVVQMTGHGADAGDPDLYVRFTAKPHLPTRKWDCRPYLDGPEESCTLDVPAGVRRAYIKVVGYDAGHYDLTVKHTP